MKRDYGFTLIELLAVIIILAVLALITTPIILNMLDQAKKSAFKEAIHGLVRAVATEDANSGFNQELTILVEKGKASFKDGEVTKEIDTKGNMPIDGYILTDVDGNAEYQLQNEKWCATQNFSEDEMTIKAGACQSITPPIA